MPTTIEHLRDEFNLPVFNKVSWGEPIPTNDEGVYIVSLSDSPTYNSGLQADAPISAQIIRQWLEKTGGFKLDGKSTCNSSEVIQRIAQFWFPDESILYIGKAPKRSNGNGLRNRVNEYYKTEYGDRRPHAGGHWIKAISILEESFVYYTMCSDPSSVEEELLKYFCENTSKTSRSIIRDPKLALPFANLQLKPGQIKSHGLSGMKK
jgi:hypothetical protein